jgi:hypothetical protein
MLASVHSMSGRMRSLVSGVVGRSVLVLSLIVVCESASNASERPTTMRTTSTSTTEAAHSSPVSSPTTTSAEPGMSTHIHTTIHSHTCKRSEPVVPNFSGLHQKDFKHHSTAQLKGLELQRLWESHTAWEVLASVFLYAQIQSWS